MRQLKDYLSIRQDKDGWVPQPDFSEPEIRVLKLQAVPEYEAESDDKRRRKRILPCKETVSLKIPYLIGKRESGLHCGMIPSLDIEYEVTRPEELEDMALHYARRELKGLTPADLLRHLPPVEW
jgi:ATP-dependent Clp protease ATP-binding subunit ClpC